jgi:hypothetical protein
MRMTMLLLMTALLPACASQSRPEPEREAVQDFVAVRNLEEVDKIKTDTGDSWQELNAYYMIYKARRAKYLVELVRACWELEDQRVVADKRWDARTIRPRFDTIRGCRIAKIYGLTEADAIELNELGETPGSRN